MEYNFSEIEKKWRDHWNRERLYEVSNDSSKPACYVLDMFPYPSGAGLHVGHPLGYIASDIYARFKRLKGFNVLHPMGYDAFGLPAEQYAIEHGIHPAVSTEENIRNFRKQLDKIGFSFDWSRQVKTSDPGYYRWTQWIFLQLFNSWYNHETRRAEKIDTLQQIFEREGNARVRGQRPVSIFTAADWKKYDVPQRMEALMEFRLAYCSYGEVNWCEALGTVLANDEVINGVSERGGYPVVKKRLRQWYLRITEYADRLLEGLERIEFSESMKEMQSNWIGKSYGVEMDFAVKENIDSGALQQDGPKRIRVYTTRPDTIFGVDFMVLSPEHELVDRITTPERKEAVEAYRNHVQSRSERERMAEKKISGCFTGAYALNPFSQKEIPVWISEYVLAGYGTGAIMAVPCGDERDFKFARYFQLPITNIIGSHFNGEEANPTKDALLENSGFLNGTRMRDAMETVIGKIESLGIGVRKINYKMRDAAFSRQRYWGEPFPVIWKHGVAYPMEESALPVLLPEVESYKPGPEGEGPLANLREWVDISSSYGEQGGTILRETNTMPGYAGSSWYFLRYMDPENGREFCSRKASDYWGQVDLYIGGTEHAVGHLLYSRMWTKVLFDLGYIGFDEPYKKLVNQGMIQGGSRFVYRLLAADPALEELLRQAPVFVSSGILERLHGEELRQFVDERISRLFGFRPAKQDYDFIRLHVDVNAVDGTQLNIPVIRKWRPEFELAHFLLEDGTLASPGQPIPDSVYLCGTEVEKMSKSKFNTVNPDDLVEKYGADTFRMYEMFLGPVEQSKPWDTKGIEGVHRFLKKLWRLFYDETKGSLWTNDSPSDAEWKVLHKTIRKIEEDTERFSFNTAVSAFMIAVNELHELKCHKRLILEPLLIILAPYAPHISEELFQAVRSDRETILVLNSRYPSADPKYLVESAKNYPIAINGKTRTELSIALDASQEMVEEMVMHNEVVKKWLEGRRPKKIIYVKNKMINIVV